MTAAAEPTLEALSDRARGLLQGALDIHVHADPDPYAERKADFAATVARAREAGLAGLVLKSHEYPTQPLAWTLDREFSGIDVCGGVALDWGVGGLNPEAASITLRIGGKVVWMPTFDALHWRSYRPGGFNSPQEPITVLDEDGKLLPVCHEILDVIASHDAVLASGHLSPAETQALLGEGLARDIRCVITHASFWTPVELQQEIVSKGGYIEQCAIAVAGEDEGRGQSCCARCGRLGRSGSSCHRTTARRRTRSRWRRWRCSGNASSRRGWRMRKCGGCWGGTRGRC